MLIKTNAMSLSQTTTVWESL